MAIPHFGGNWNPQEVSRRIREEIREETRKLRKAKLERVFKK